jgi:hypothetical protein
MRTFFQKADPHARLPVSNHRFKSMNGIFQRFSAQLARFVIMALDQSTVGAVCTFSRDSEAI